jgi:hypothetical protein
LAAFKTPLSSLTAPSRKIRVLQKAEIEKWGLRETNRALAAASFLPQTGRLARVLLSLAEAFKSWTGPDRTTNLRANCKYVFGTE